MRTKRLVPAVLLLSGLAGGPVQAAPDGRQIATTGQGGAPCQSCHGSHGEGNAAAGFPRLAGLNADYLARQLRAFRDGTRQNPVMAPQVKGLDDAAIDAVAGHYAGLPAPETQPADLSAEQRQRGRALAQHGRWSDNIPACTRCHGPGGRGIAPHFPSLAGQHAGYLAAQLHAWQQGSRHDDPNGLMAAVAGRLSDAEIQAVSAWFASRPTRPQATDQ